MASFGRYSGCLQAKKIVILTFLSRRGLAGELAMGYLNAWIY
jgi:hypothetical protein